MHKVSEENARLAEEHADISEQHAISTQECGKKVGGVQGLTFPVKSL